MKAGDIDILNIERLFVAESKRRQAFLKRRSSKLLWFIMIGLVLTFIFL